MMNLSVPDSLPSQLQNGAIYQNLVAGQTLFHFRDPAEYIFALEVGRIRLVRYTCEGNLVVFQIVRATSQSFTIVMRSLKSHLVLLLILKLQLRKFCKTTPIWLGAF